MLHKRILPFLHEMCCSDHLSKCLQDGSGYRFILSSVMTLLLLAGVFLGSQRFFEIRKEESIPATSTDTKQYTIVIDSGHGGRDAGKVSESGIQEKDINLSIALLLQQKLMESGISVVMTRTEDIGLYNETDRNKKAADMKKRLQIIEESGADLAISIHQNSFEDSTISGAQVFYYTTSIKGKELAETIQKNLKESIDSNNKRKAKANDTYYLLKKTSVPLVIAECGFLSNPYEAALLSTPEYQERLAETIKESLLFYLTQIKE